MSKLSFGIRGQLTAGIVIITLAGIGLIGLLSIKIVERSSLFWKMNEASGTVRFVETALEYPRASDAPSMLNYISRALRSAGTDYFMITDGTGRALLSEGRPPEGGEELDSPPGLSVKSIGGGWFRGPGEKLLVSAPINGAGLKGGSIEFTVSLDDINASLSGARRFLLLYALLDSIIIIAFGVFFLARYITGPIKELDAAATRIAGGKLNERANVAEANEIGSLAASFNSMAGRLEAEIKSLDRVNKELMETQEELLRSSTLAAVGRLAAGIAHEIGNPLGAVNGYLDILYHGVEDKAEEREIIERLMKEASRIDQIVREFLDISRPPRKASTAVDLNAVLEETAASVAFHKDFSGMEIIKGFTEGLPPVVIDDGKLRQVFMNILLNAAHSLADKEGEKTISIETGMERKASGRRTGRRRDDPPMELNVEEKDFVFARIKDNGYGMSDEVASRVFDPFFTTKDVGKGTGLGLFVSQSIIKTYGGEISLDTGVGRGAAFTVTLPAGRRDT